MTVPNDPNALSVYTDGSFSPDPWRGGGGIVYVSPINQGEEIIFEKSMSQFQGATINQMELMACIEAVKGVQRIKNGVHYYVGRLIIYSDSKYVVDNYPKAIYEWSINKWRLSSGAPVENKNLWKELLSIVGSSQVRVDIVKVKAHSGNVFNGIADGLAKKSRESFISKIDVSKTKVIRKKITKNKTVIGSVKLFGRKAAIRVVSAGIIDKNETKYRYEVVSRGNVYYGKIDIVYSRLTLRPGHVYFVKFAIDDTYPQIEKVYRERI